MIIYLPIENMEQRYTKMMNQVLYEHVDTVIYPDLNLGDDIKVGEFLDVNKTNIFKAAQLKQVSEMFYRNEIRNGDIFLIGDIFFPGIEMIKYMSELQDIDIKIYGFNYAGRADSTDFVQRLKEWADPMEKAFHLVCDKVFVGSKSHAKAIKKYFGYDRVAVTGLIWDTAYVKKIYEPTENEINIDDVVIFPHRLCKEKGIDELYDFSKKTKRKILITSSGSRNSLFDKYDWPKNVDYKYSLLKKDYYRLMARSRYYISFARQETFGYTLQEAILYRCNILVPDTACYKEMVPKKNIFKLGTDNRKIDEKFNENLIVDIEYTSRWNRSADNVLREMLSKK